MRCEEARWLGHRRIDGELRHEEEEALRRHLEPCKDCHDRLRELEELARLVGEVGSLDRPGITASDSSAPRRAHRASGAFASTLAASLLLAAILFLTESLLPPPAREAGPLPGEVASASAGEWLAVSLPSHHPDVHILWLYEPEPSPWKGESR
ncbi:MAG: anti-sigma factor family protein [Planctomycetota bacterium]